MTKKSKNYSSPLHIHFYKATAPEKKLIQNIFAKIPRNPPPSQLRGKSLWRDCKDLYVSFIDVSTMTKTNSEFRGKNKPTDVLSFIPTPPNKEKSLGEIVLCREIIKKQALEFDWTYQNELSKMVIHSFLHLLGYDHELNSLESRLQGLWELRLTNYIYPRTKI